MQTFGNKKMATARLLIAISAIERKTIWCVNVVIICYNPTEYDFK